MKKKVCSTSSQQNHFSVLMRSECSVRRERCRSTPTPTKLFAEEETRRKKFPLNQFYFLVVVVVLTVCVCVCPQWTAAGASGASGRSAAPSARGSAAESARPRSPNTEGGCVTGRRWPQRTAPAACAHRVSHTPSRKKEPQLRRPPEVALVHSVFLLFSFLLFSALRR